MIYPWVSKIIPLELNSRISFCLHGVVFHHSYLTWQLTTPSVAQLAACTNEEIVNTFRPRQIGCHFADDILNCIFLNENVWIPIKISLKFVPKDPINNIPALVQIMVWRRPGDKPLSEPMMVNLLTHICVTRPQWVKLDEHYFWHPVLFFGYHQLIGTYDNSIYSLFEMRFHIFSWDITVGNKRNLHFVVQ